MDGGGMTERSTPKALKPHQRKAFDAVMAAIGDGGRAQISMACGTGKTLVGLRTAEAVHQRVAGGRVLVLVPSLGLIDQTVRAWRADTAGTFDAFAFCSDKRAAAEDIAAEQLSIPSTTTPQVLADWLDGRSNDRLVVVFCTYQSTVRLADIHHDRAHEWDVVVVDEAHRTAGEMTKPFGTILHDHLIPAQRRLFMTATPRVHTSSSVTVDGGGDATTVASMDDTSLYGSRVYELTFGQAIAQDLLSPYQVAIVVVTDDDVARLIANPSYDTTLADGGELSVQEIAGQIALARASEQFGLHRIIVFHNTISASKRFASAYSDIAGSILNSAFAHGTTVRHLDGSATADERRTCLTQLGGTGDDAYMVVTNSKVLTEGINVPALDAIMFAQPRSSQIDVTQAVGRAIRKHPRRNHPSVIVLPVYLTPDDDPETAVDDTNFRAAAQTLRALQDHDQQLEFNIAAARRSLATPGNHPRLPDNVTVLADSGVVDSIAGALTVRLIQVVSDPFEEGVAYLHRYVAEHGTSRPPYDAVIDGYRIGQWVTNRRSEYKAGRLDADRIHRLETEFPDWVWSVNDAEFEEGITRLHRYVAEHGTSRPPYDAVIDGYRIGQWVTNRRSEYKAGRLDADRIHRLETEFPDWVWSAQ